MIGSPGLYFIQGHTLFKKVGAVTKVRKRDAEQTKAIVNTVESQYRVVPWKPRQERGTKMRV